MDPAFIQPETPTPEAAIAALRDDFEVLDDWEDRFAFIIHAGRAMPAFPRAWMDDAHRVPGCQSQVWMEVCERDGRLYFAGTSDALIVRGLVAILLGIFSGRTPHEIASLDTGFLSELELTRALTVNRGSGLEAMVLAIRRMAARAETAS